jgi:hypothetical protein
LPAGHSTASFQITLESIDPLYRDDATVGPYSVGQVAPSGSHTAILLAGLVAGSDVQQDIVMTGGAATRSVDQPLTLRQPVPPGGDWWGALAGYSRTEFYRFTAQAGRTIGFQVVSTDESRAPAINKTQPELGLWVGADPASTLPQASADAFNGPTTGASILLAPVIAAGSAQLGIADYRGDGRPDFFYHAHLLYADAVTPARLPDSGGAILITGIGFRPGMAVTVGNAVATVLSVSQDSIFAQAPGLADGGKDVTVREATSGLTSAMSGALTYGVSNADLLLSSSLGNPTVAVGMIAPNPARFKVVAGDGVTAAPGTAVTLSVSPVDSRLNSCGSSACSLIADSNGEVSSFVTVNAAGLNLVTASLINGQQQQTSMVGTLSQTLSALTPTVRVLAGSSAILPLAVKMMSAGVAVSGKTVNFTITSGTGTLDHSSVATDGNGNAAANLTVVNFTASASINACSGTTCAQFAILPVATNTISLRTVSGDGQMIAVGQSLQPMVLRVTDSANPPNSLGGIPVTVSTTVFAAMRPDCAADTGICQPAMPHALATFNTVLTSDANGLISYAPLLQVAWGAVTVNVIATAGSSASQALALQVFAPSQ